MTIFKRCPSCQNIYDRAQNPKGCPLCREKWAKHYDNINAKRRQERNPLLKVYGTRRWRKCRDTVRLRYQDMDIWALGIGRVVRCEKPYIHHIEERDDRPDLLFDLDNLITVSYESHEEIHEMYLKDKAGAIARIRAGIERFMEMFT